jgi:tRNA(Ile)-lysidine synthase
MSLTEQFRNHLATSGLAPCRVLVAVSGGPDSVTLLDLLVRTKPEHRLDLVVGHVDHGIHPESAQVAERVRSLAESYGLPIEVGQLSLGPSATETVARARRYAWLEETRSRTGAKLIFTAHHADDQAETVLMRALEGSGPAGLAGIAGVQGRLVRPLLPFRRTELLRHLRESGLSAWVDPSNQDSRHLRSWIRTELLPFVRRRLPKIDSHLNRLSVQAREDRAAWDAALALLPGLELQDENDAISVAAPALAGYDSALRQAILQALARKLGHTLGPTRLGRVLQLLEGVESGSRVPLGSSWWAELSYNRLRLYRHLESVADPPWKMRSPAGEGAWGRWHFRWEIAPAPDQHERAAGSAWLTLDPVTVRAWEAGEKLKPLGGRGRRLVVRCFQEERVPLSRRESWPVLTQGDDLIWIPRVCRSALRLPTAGTEALRVDAQYA